MTTRDEDSNMSEDQASDTGSSAELPSSTPLSSMSSLSSVTSKKRDLSDVDYSDADEYQSSSDHEKPDVMAPKKRAKATSKTSSAKKKTPAKAKKTPTAISGDEGSETVEKTPKKTARKPASKATTAAVWDKAEDDAIIQGRKQGLPWKEIAALVNNLNLPGRCGDNARTTKMVKNRYTNAKLKMRDLELSDDEMKLLVQAEKDVEGVEKYRFVATRLKELCEQNGVDEPAEGGLDKTACQTLLKSRKKSAAAAE